jgi:iron complex transport system substrate-binding protein
MVAAGPGTYIDDLLRRAGVDNVLSDAPVRYVQISAEEVLARAPDVILDAVHADDPRKAREDWNVLAAVPAVKAGRVHVLGDPLFVTPGPRLDQAFTRLVDILW